MPSLLSSSSAPWAAHAERPLKRLGSAVRAFDGPVLGICAGMQLQAMFAGGSVRSIAPRAEQSYRAVEVLDDGDLLGGLPEQPFFCEHRPDRRVAAWLPPTRPKPRAQRRGDPG